MDASDPVGFTSQVVTTLGQDPSHPPAPRRLGVSGWEGRSPLDLNKYGGYRWCLIDVNRYREMLGGALGTEAEPC